jgi:hypothetical protein
MNHEKISLRAALSCRKNPENWFHGRGGIAGAVVLTHHARRINIHPDQGSYKNHLET